MKRIKTFALGALFLALASGPALAVGPYMKTAGTTSRPIGHDQFCRQYSSECNERSARSYKVKMSNKRWRELVSVNADVNLSVRPVTDQEHYGVEEHWTYPQGYGDCEDYVLMKRYMLMQKGWPASALLITVVLQPDGSGHAVLTARTSKGDYILDNLRPDVQVWTKTPYQYLKRQSSRDSARWVRIADNRYQYAQR